MRILHVIPSLAEADGGPTRAIALMEQALATQGLHIEVAATDDDGRGGRLAPAAGAGGVGAVRHYFRKTTNFYKTSLAMARWLSKHVGAYDVVHIHALFSFSSTAAAWFARRRGVPYVLRPLGTLAHYGLGRRRPRLKRWSIAMIEGPMLRSAAAVHFTSDMEREEACSLGIDMNAAVIPLAVGAGPEPDRDALLESFPALRDRRFVLFLSRIDPKKNVEALIGAAEICAATEPEMLWLVAGSGEPEYIDSLKALARSRGVERQLVWTGHLEGGRKAAALAHAEMFVLPSRSENFGIAVAEALHAGLPAVVAEGVALGREIADCKAGILIKPTAEDLAQATLRLWNGEELRASASANARQLAAAQFSLEALGRRLSELYAKVTRDGTREGPDAR